MINPDTILGLGIVLASLTLIGLWVYENRDTASLTDPYILINLGVAAGATVLMYLGFLQTMQSLLTPVTRLLADTVGIPLRWQSDAGMGATRYTPTDILRVLIVIPVFVYASYRDIKERIVRNWVWYPLFVYGLVFLIYDIWAGTLNYLAPYILGNILFATILGFILFKTRLFGGADMKALWGLGIILPTYPNLIVFPRVLPELLNAPLNALNMFALTILANTAIVALCWPLYTFYRNVKTGGFDANHLGLMFTAKRVNLEDSLETHGKILPIWAFETGGFLSRGKVLLLSVIHGFDTQFIRDYLKWHNSQAGTDITNPTEIKHHHVKRFVELDDNEWETDDTDEAIEAFSTLLEKETVWMTPGIPFIVPMLLGLILSLTIGDIVYWIVVALN